MEFFVFISKCINHSNDSIPVSWLNTSIVPLKTQEFSMHTKPVFDSFQLLLIEWLTKAFRLSSVKC
jgi:hypothetical protein